MRAVFGLAGLLVTIGIIVLMMKAYHPADVVNIGKKAEDQVRQMAGRDENNKPVKQTVTLTAFAPNGKVKYVLVADILPDSPLKKFYGVERNDAIIQAGDMDLKDWDGELAKELVLRAYSTQGALVVMRDGQKLKLPDDRPKPQPAGQPANKSALNQQIDAIQGP